jgi:diguanylate cyclase (GGDEF)-like protein/PAS domain S-box-containing protein
MTDSDRTAHLKQIIELQARLTDADLDLEGFMAILVEAATGITGAVGAAVEFVEGDEMVYRCVTRSYAAHVGTRLPRANSLSGLCVQRAEVLHCEDTSRDPRVNAEACARVGVASMVCAPLFQRGAPIGVLKVMSDRKQGFDAQDVETLTVMAGVLGAALGKQMQFDSMRRVEARLTASEARVRALLERANDAVIVLDDAGRVTEWNRSATDLFGWRPLGVAGEALSDLIVAPEHRAESPLLGARLMTDGAPAVTSDRFEIAGVDRAGAPLELEIRLSAVPVDTHWEFLVVCHDIGQRKALEAALREAAFKDGLTGLPNRRALMEAVDQSIARHRRHGHPFAILYMDLDGFKGINDVHGHAAGDRALQEFAARVSGCMRRTDQFARLGGDEFVLLAEGLANEEQAAALAHKITQALAEPMRHPDIPLRTSIGVALYDGEPDASSLLRAADRAMYERKRARRTPA